jgi:glucose/arabinose dehydrogenase
VGTVQFPEEYRGDAFVAFHGSWNRTVPTGYKVVRIRVENGRPVAYEDFATGWLRPEGRVEGRPVYPVVAPDGSLLVSDDGTGRIWRIRYVGS